MRLRAVSVLWYWAEEEKKSVKYKNFWLIKSTLEKFWVFIDNNLKAVCHLDFFEGNLPYISRYNNFQAKIIQKSTRVLLTAYKEVKSSETNWFNKKPPAWYVWLRQTSTIFKDMKCKKKNIHNLQTSEKSRNKKDDDCHSQHLPSRRHA